MQIFGWNKGLLLSCKSCSALAHERKYKIFLVTIVKQFCILLTLITMCLHGPLPQVQSKTRKWQCLVFSYESNDLTFALHTLAHWDISQNKSSESGFSVVSRHFLHSLPSVTSSTCLTSCSTELDLCSTPPSFLTFSSLVTRCLLSLIRLQIWNK